MNKRKFYRLLDLSLPIAMLMSVLLGTTSAKADTDKTLYIAQTPNLPPNDSERLPRTPLPGEREEPTITPLPPIEDFLNTPPNRLPEAEDLKSEIEFEVNEFQLEGNTVLEAEEVDPVFAQYRDRPITFTDLLELETELTRLYTERGYINSGVIIPAEQNITQGTVKLQAVEGTIEEIKVNVDGRLEESYIRSRLARGAKTPLNIEELQEALQLLQLNPLVESINAELSVGRSRDRWTLDVRVNQGEAFNPVLFANNNRTPSVGSFQRGIELNHDNVSGYADRLSFVFRDTDGSDDFDASYSVPVNSLDGTVGLRYRYVDSNIIEGNFEIADIESQTDELELTLRQPILLEYNSESTQELALGLEFSRQTNEVTAQGQPLPDLSPGANADGETRISALRFFQDWTRRSRRDVIAARSQLSAGIDAFNATIDESLPADAEFVAWRGQVQWLRQLDPDSNLDLLLRSDIQLSSDDLVPLERFSLGGSQSVRGYRQDALLGDNGVFASAELRIPVYRWSNNRNSLAAIPFVDFGTTRSNSDTRIQEEDTVVSLGVGMRLDLIDILSARIDYGIPLIEVNDSDDTLQEQGLYFSLEYFPF